MTNLERRRRIGFHGSQSVSHSEPSNLEEAVDVGARTRGNAKDRPFFYKAVRRFYHAGLDFFNAVYSFRRVFTTPYWHFNANASLFCKVRRIQIGRIGLFDFFPVLLAPSPNRFQWTALNRVNVAQWMLADQKKCPSLVSSVGEKGKSG